MKFRNIILPDESFFFDNAQSIRMFTNEYRETIERVRHYAQKNFTPLDNNKYYFFHGLNQIGEERLAKYFESKGYRIILSGNIDLDSELNVLANCESFASTLGSCSHNVVFMKDNAEVILIPRSCYLTGHQDPLDQMRNNNVTYIDSSLSIFQPSNGGPFCYIISNQLKKFFCDECTGEYSDEDFINFLLHVKRCMSKGLKPPEETLKYYATILPEFRSQLLKRQDLMKKVGIFMK